MPQESTQNDGARRSDGDFGKYVREIVGRPAKPVRPVQKLGSLGYVFLKEALLLIVGRPP